MLPDPIIEKIKFELESIEHELMETRGLFEKLVSTDPDTIEIRAAAASLHAFYNGIEKIFEAITRQIDGIIPEGDRWHNSLLREMSLPAEKRSKVISAESRNALEPYLAFRHFFRHSYGFVLDWKQLKPLCIKRANTYKLLRVEIDYFLSGKI